MDIEIILKEIETGLLDTDMSLNTIDDSLFPSLKTIHIVRDLISQHRELELFELSCSLRVMLFDGIESLSKDFRIVGGGDNRNVKEGCESGQSFSILDDCRHLINDGLKEGLKITGEE